MAMQYEEGEDIGKTGKEREMFVALVNDAPKGSILKISLNISALPVKGGAAWRAMQIMLAEEESRLAEVFM